MTLSPETVLSVIGMSVTLASLIWYTGLYVGRLSNRLERVEKKVEDLEKKR